MGGLLSLSRILGYHAKERPSVRPRYSFIEARMNYLVTIPGAVITIVCGVWLAWQHGGPWFAVAVWMHWKLALVFVVLTIHFVLTKRQRAILRAAPDAPINKALFAALHGTLGLLLIAILLLATHQPMKQ
jgi:uncharacterized membrane protein